MTVLSSLLFSCFQAFFAVPSHPAPLSRPPFVTNLLRQPVSDLFQFYAAFSLPSRLISFSVTFSLPYCLILDFFFATFSASIILSVYNSRAIILSVSPAYTKSIYIIAKCYFECRFGSNLYSPSAVKYLFFYLFLGQRQ